MNFYRIPIVFAFATCLLAASCEKESPNVVPKVNAGADVTIKLGLDSVLLSGDYTDPDDKVVVPLWSQVSGDQSASIETPVSIKTWVKNLKEGSYVFQLMATDGQGGIGYDTVAVTVLPADVDSITLTPDNNPNEVHIFGNNVIDQSTASAPEILGGSGTYYGDTVNIRAVLKFDLSAIPTGKTIKSAKLTLYSNHTPLNGQGGNANSGSDNTLYIERVVDSWDPMDVKWLAQPSSTATDHVVIPHTSENFLDLVDVDVTALVSTMVSSGSNNGFMLKLKNEIPYNFRIFCSSKYSDATRHPKLQVYYTKD